MEFVINNECFNKAITDVSKAISLKTTLSILSGIKIVANSNCLILVGSNSDIVIEKIIPLMMDDEKVLEVYDTGSVVVSAKYLSEIARKLPKDIHLKVNEKQLVTIQSDEIITTLNGFHSEEYPRLPQIDETTCIKISSMELIEIINQTSFAVSKSESRPVLTGVNLSFNEKHLSCAATNSQRLAFREIPIRTDVNGSFIVPSSSLNELTKLFKNEAGPIHIYITDNYIVFKSNTISLFSRLIEGNYPNVSGLLPKESKTIIIMDTNQLLKGIDRACLFANEWKNNNVNLEIIDGSIMKISSNSTEIGKIEETQTIKMIKGETDLSISLDGSFFIDALKAIKEEEIRISFGGPMRPVLIEPVNNPFHLHLISPVRTY
ncbi:DNA polymerase III subunit beta [Cytobacillus massiliigabonensis]|uniref:DNA polymerase III subunit beta n=1 Tax=Cytobacillus massiliigabonensis TaxID=1871011 RepID=UPI000C84F523|nr:DNA polymerase III subunit beta [Cytobacillus massiliigabonensis]